MFNGSKFLFMKKSLIALCLFSGLAITIANTNVGNRYFEIAKNLEIFASLYKEVIKYYVNEVNPNTLLKIGVDSMLNSLDPYTNYIPENEIEDYKKTNTGQYGGIGALTTHLNGVTKVIMVYEGFAAHKNGIKIGDIITAVGGIKINDKSQEEINLIMKGESGTKTTLTINRLGLSEPLKINIERENITINHIPYYSLIEKDIGYVKLTEFSQGIGKKTKSAIKEMIDEGAKSIVLDLRDNPGGLLIEAVNVCNIFLPKGREIVYTKDKLSNKTVYPAKNNPVNTKIPVAVLINSRSASSSEIVAGTLQDYDRALIVGKKSFGKGLVQVPKFLPYNAQVKITIAKYYTPSGRCIQTRDYSPHNAGENAKKIANLPKKTFKTTNGRPVYGGGGVTPEVIVEGNQFAEIVTNLQQLQLTLDYATKYYCEHGTPPTESFTVSDEIYADFIMWLNLQPMETHTSLEKQVTELEVMANSKELNIQSPLSALRKLLEEEKKQGLTRYKAQIKIILEREIAAHYFLEKGQIEASLKYDKPLKEAVKILKNTDQYLQRLQSND